MITISPFSEIPEKLPERPKKVSHTTGEVFQMWLNRKERELNEGDTEGVYQRPDNRDN